MSAVAVRAGASLPSEVLELIAKHQTLGFFDGMVERMLAEHAHVRAPHPSDERRALIVCRDAGPTVLYDEFYSLRDEAMDLAVEEWARYSVMLVAVTAEGPKPLRFFTRRSRGCNIEEARARLEDIVERALGHPGYSPTSPAGPPMSPGRPGYDDWEWPEDHGTTAYKEWQH